MLTKLRNRIDLQWRVCGTLAMARPEIWFSPGSIISSLRTTSWLSRLDIQSRVREQYRISKNLGSAGLHTRRDYPKSGKIEEVRR